MVVSTVPGTLAGIQPTLRSNGGMITQEGGDFMIHPESTRIGAAVSVLPSTLTSFARLATQFLFSNVFPPTSGSWSDPMVCAFAVNTKAREIQINK
jgi:hypothetical protein